MLLPHFRHSGPCFTLGGKGSQHAETITFVVHADTMPPPDAGTSEAHGPTCVDVHTEEAASPESFLQPLPDGHRRSWEWKPAQGTLPATCGQPQPYAPARPVRWAGRFGDVFGRVEAFASTCTILAWRRACGRGPSIRKSFASWGLPGQLRTRVGPGPLHHHRLLTIAAKAQTPVCPSRRATDTSWHPAVFTGAL